MKTKPIVALDTPDIYTAKSLVVQLGGSIDFYKVGLEAFLGCGEGILDFLKEKDKKIFLDLKFHDIPNTVASATLACLKYNVDILNVHAQGGTDMMHKTSEQLSEACSKTGGKKPLLVAVTLLTSLGEDYLKTFGINFRKSTDYVLHLAELAKKSGLDGIVSSPKEVQIVKNKLGNDFLTITPGIRPEWSVKNDQQRVVTPKMAAEIGCDYIVIGRPVTAADDPLLAATKIIEEIEYDG